MRARSTFCLHAFDHRDNFIRCEEVRCNFGHSVFRRCLHLAEFVFGYSGVFVLDHPHVKLFENADPVVDGILFEIISKPVLRGFKISLRCVNIGDSIGFERARIFLQPTRV